MSRAFNCSRLALVAGTALALTACLDHPLKPVEFDKSEEAENTVAIAINKDVDILFVIDNSGSMAEEQQRVAENFAAFINVLEAPDVQANYRIGITTTDAGNPRCPNTTPENGNLVLSSCLDRIEQGQFESQGTDYSTACTANCSLGDDVLKIKGTVTEEEPNTETPRKWIEKINGVSNVEGTDSMVDAFRCFGPQGVAGCGFESHLESMFKGLANAKTKANKNNFGFLRDQAILSIVIITDEADCSFNPEFDEIFTPDNKVFWFDPEKDVAPTSSLCWKAGVKCEGSSPYATCRAQDYDVTGAETDDPKKAVLKPVDDYIDYVQKIEDEKQGFDQDQQVLVSLIAGVPSMYESYGSELVYADSPDVSPEGQQRLFGIGPGCIVGPMDAPTATAVPPVREREFAEAFLVEDPENPGRNLYSICDSDYSAALFDIADKIRDQIKPACMPNCVADTDPTSPDVLDANCNLYEENLALGIKTPIVKCVEGKDSEGNPAWTAPAMATVCFATLVDQKNITPSKLDDMSTECIDDGFNLEFILVRSGAPGAGTTISAACELSDNKRKDCPNL